jgi:Zn-dependent protease
MLNGGGIRLFTLRGIEIRLDYSWFIIFALVTYSLAEAHYPREWPLVIRGTLGVVTSLLFFLSVLLHELAHSFVAQTRGIRVPRITLFIFGGAAQIAEEPKSAGDEFFMAMAGPVMSVVIALVSGLLYLFFTRIALDPLASLFGWLAIINVTLAVFNLIPGFPLDGGRVLRALLWGASQDMIRSTRVAAWAGQAVAIGFIALGAAMIVFMQAGVNGLWMAFIGFFLLRAARQALDRVRIQELLAGHLAGEVMWSDCVFVDPATPLSELFYQQVLRAGRRCFPVMEHGRVTGLVTTESLRRVPSSAWPAVTAGEIMTPAESIRYVSPDAPLNEALELMLGVGGGYIPVV